MDCSEGCPRAAVMFGVPGVDVLDAEADDRGLRLTVETDQQVEGCRACGVLAVLHDRRAYVLHDAPFGHRRVLVRWRKRVWRCTEPACPVVTFTEAHPLAPPRALLTRRAVVWAADALEQDTPRSRRWPDGSTSTGTTCGTPSRSRPKGAPPTPAVSSGSRASGSTSTPPGRGSSAPAGR